MTMTGLTADQMLSAACRRWFEDLAERGIFITDTSLVVRTWNPWLEVHTQIPADSAIGRPLLEVNPSIGERGLDQYFRDALRGEVRLLSERFHRYLFKVERAIPSVGVFEMAQTVRIAPLFSEDAIVGTITVIDDVTERVVSERELRNQIALSDRARAAAEEASTLKDEFLATLSHEIRTPLNAVLGWARILRTQPNHSSRERALDVIERNAATQLRLIEDLLDMSRVVSGKLQLDIRTISVGDVVSAARDAIAPAADAKQIALAATIPDGLPQVAGDGDRLQQAVWNLLSNAVKFTDRGGRVNVSVTRCDDALDITVADTGQGISQEFLPYIFDRFRQADASASRRHGGLGLGLALVRHIAELHGGTIAAHSAGLNRGTTMTLRLPVSRAMLKAPRVVPPAGLTLRGIRVLVVDDDPDGREVLAVALQEFGASVRAVSTSQEVLEVLRKRSFNPHVMLADLAMPDVDGFDLIRGIRGLESPSARTLPAIAVTAYANATDRHRAQAAGYQAHVTKPIDPSVVAAAIISVLERTPPHQAPRLNDR